MKEILLFSLLFASSALSFSGKLWSEFSLNEQAEILNDLAYYSKEDLPKDIDVVTYVDSFTSNFEIEKIHNLDHKSYIRKMSETFENEVSRETIEQSPYSTFGLPRIVELYLLVSYQKIRGGYVRYYQDGRDEDGKDNDINWQASVRFDRNANLFVDNRGEPFDDLYYEWSGH